MFPRNIRKNIFSSQFAVCASIPPFSLTLILLLFLFMLPDLGCYVKSDPTCHVGSKTI